MANIQPEGDSYGELSKGFDGLCFTDNAPEATIEQDVDPGIWPTYYKYNQLIVDTENPDDWKFYDHDHFPQHWDEYGWGWHPLWQAMRDKEQLGLDSMAFGNFSAAVQYLRQAYELAKKRLNMPQTDFWTCGVHKYPVSDCFNLCIELSQAFRCQKRFKTARRCLQESRKYSSDDGLLWLAELEEIRVLIAEGKEGNLSLAKAICETTLRRFGDDFSAFTSGSFRGVEIRDEFILALVEIHNSTQEFGSINGYYYSLLSQQGMQKLLEPRPLDEQWIPNIPFRRAFSTSEISDMYFDLSKANDADRLLERLDQGLDLSDHSPIMHQIYWPTASLLHYVVRSSYSREVRFNIEAVLRGHEHMIDLEDEDGETPLMWALRSGSLLAARVLLEHGADGTKPRRVDKTRVRLALEASPSFSNREASQVEPISGSTMLHTLVLAASKFNFGDADLEDITRLLVEAGADVEARDSKLRTPFDLAAADAKHTRMKTILDSLRQGGSPAAPARPMTLDQS